MAIIDDYVVTPGGVVDVGGNPVTYDAFGNINPTYTTALVSSGTDIAKLFTPYKKLFEKITKGEAGATEYAAAAGILGLLVPSLNKPQTPGWKGSIDLNKQYTRTPIAQPAFTPYAQSASPVMGRQFFNTTYGAAPAAPPAAGEGIPAPVAPPTTNPDLHGAGLARGGIANLRKFAAGGSTGGTVNVQSFGIAGDGKPLDAKMLSDLLTQSAGKSLYFPAGTYTLSNTLTIPSNITLTGDGAGKTIFLANKDYDPNAPLIRAQDKASDISINGITFDGGNNPRKGTSGLVDLGHTSNLTFANSAVQNTQYIGLDLAGTKNATVQGSLFTNCGNPEPSKNGGSAIYVGGEADAQSQNINVVGNTFKDNNWSAAYFMPVGGQFSNNTCINNGESTLFMNNTGRDVVIANNTIDGTRRFDVSAAGLELGGQNLKVYNNTITNAGADGISLTDVSNSLIENNNVFNNGKESSQYEPFKYAAGIGVHATSQNSNNVIQNNTIYDDQQSPTQQYGIFGWADKGNGWQNSQISNNTIYGHSLGDVQGLNDIFGQSVGANINQAPASQAMFSQEFYESPEQGSGTSMFQPTQQPAQQPMQQLAQQPTVPDRKPLGLASLLPTGWSGYEPTQKIDWFNQNQVGADQLLGAGVGQDEIDWMKTQGYLGSYQPQNDQLRTFKEETQQMPLGGLPLAQTTVTPTLPQMPPPTPPEPMPRSPLLFEEQKVEAAQGGIMGYARGGMPPRYLRGQTDGMADKIPSNIDGVQPAKLSHGEFVIPADVVSHLGNGNSDAGAKVLYKMMDRVRRARTGTKKQGRQINPEKFTPGGIAGYAGGGAVAFQAGGTTGTTAPLGTSTETNISEWAGPYVGDMLSKTAALTNTPYQAYQGPLVAGTAPLQSKVFGGLESLNFPGQLGQSFTAQGAYQLPSMTPGGVMGQATGPTGIASQYMNPYLSAVLTPQLDELRRQSQITQMGTAGKLAQAGAFGGSRQAIMDAETQRNLLAEQNKAIGTGYANAYDRAMGQFNIEQGQAKTLADMMAGAGQQQRGIEQEGITALQKQYETELLDPYVKLRFQKEMLQGLPVATASTTANTSTMDQLKGGLSDIQSLMKALGLA